MAYRFLSVLFCLLLPIHLYSNSSLKKVSIQLQYYNQFQFAGYYIAKEKGFYKSVGLDVEIKPYSKGLIPMDELLSGKVDFAIGRSSLLIDISKGKDIVLLASIFQSSPQILLTKKSSNILKFRDIVGKKVMITHDSIMGVALQSMLNAHSIYRDDYTSINNDYNIKNLINNKVDMMSAYISNEPFILKRMGIEPVVFHPKEYGFKFYDDVLYTTREMANNNSNVTDDFIQATLRGWEYAFSHIDEAVGIVFDKYNTQGKSKDALIYEADVLRGLAYEDGVNIGDMHRDKWYQIYNNYKLLGFIDKPIEIGSILHKIKHKKLILNEKEKLYLKEKKNISICVNPKWMPYDGIVDGKHVGIASDIMEIVQRKIHTKISVINTKTWEESLENVKSHKCDVIPLITDTISAREYLYFTKPYIKSYYVIATSTDKPFLDDESSLDGKKIAVIKGYSISNVLKSEHKDIEYVEVSSIREALELVKNGKVYGYIDSSVILKSAIEKYNLHKSIKISGRLDRRVKLSLGVRYDDFMLYSILSKVIESISNKEKNSIIDREINLSQTDSVTYSTIWKIIFIFLIPLVLILLAYQKLLDVKKNLEKKVKKEVEKSHQKDRQMLEQSRLAQMGEMISMIAHQWRQPLGVIAATGINMKMTMDLEKYDLSDDKQREEYKKYMGNELDNIENYVANLTETIDDFRNFYKPNKKREISTINVSFEKSFDILKATLEAHGVEIEKELYSKKELSLFNNELMQVFINILKNSLDNFKEKDIKDMTLKIKSIDTKEGVKLTICDNGGGIKMSIMDKIFDPYFSTKSEKSGTGLGLYMSKTIIQEHHNGKLYIENKNGGACFIVEIFE